jgi:hypothetical protein
MPFGSEALCFPRHLPVLFGDLAPRTGLETGLKMGLSGLSETQIGALGRLLPSLQCGEESAFMVFWREGHRRPDLELSQSQTLAYRIASEELEHERLLRELLTCCPVPNDLASILAGC